MYKGCKLESMQDSPCGIIENHLKRWRKWGLYHSRPHMYHQHIQSLIWGSWGNHYWPMTRTRADLCLQWLPHSPLMETTTSFWSTIIFLCIIIICTYKYKTQPWYTHQVQIVITLIFITALYLLWFSSIIILLFICCICIHLVSFSPFFSRVYSSISFAYIMLTLQLFIIPNDSISACTYKSNYTLFST